MIEVPDRVLTVVTRVVGSDRAPRLKPTSMLFDERLLDSFGLLQLVDGIEHEFNIQLRTEDLTSQNFASVSTIAALVAKVLAEKE